MATNKSFACPYCNKRFAKEDLVVHLEKKHLLELPEGFSPLRTAFHIVNRKDFDYRRPCRVCKKPTTWDENKGRYNFLCGDPNCKKKWIEIMKKNMGDKYGAFRPTSSAEGLEKMLAGRKISGKYKFKDGVEFTYTGSYELEALKFMDEVLNIKSEDLQIPAPIIEYNFKGSKHIYIPDMYYRPYNLIIEVKDGGARPNKNVNYSETRARQAAKEDYVINHTNYNYLRLTDNDFSQLLGVFADLKLHLVDEDVTRVIHVNENMFAAAQSMMPPMNANDTIIVNYGLNNVFNPSKFAIADNYKFDNLIYRDKNGILKQTNENETNNFFKVLKASENENDPYRSFIVKDRLTDKKIETLKENMNKWVSPNFIYKTIFEHEMYSEDQIQFESNIIEYDFYSETESLAESVSNYIKEDSSDKRLSEWMKRNIKYKNFNKLMDHDEVLETKSGSCHDQVMFELVELSEYHPRALFVIEYTNKEVQDDHTNMTHSLVYYHNNGKTCWFENAWGGMEGIHEFKNLKELKEKLKELHREGKFGNYKKYPYLEISPFRNHKAGENLQQFVDICLSNT